MPFFSTTMIGAMALLAHTLWLGARGRPTDMPLTREQMRAFVWWRMFYVNPADPRGWVPKPYGFGYTVNFRDRTHVTVFSVLLAFTLLSAIGQAMWAAQLASAV